MSDGHRITNLVFDKVATEVNRSISLFYKAEKFIKVGSWNTISCHNQPILSPSPPHPCLDEPIQSFLVGNAPDIT
jgi:hypothetical protein